MRDIDLQSFSLPELKELKACVEEEIIRKKEAVKVEMMDDIRRLAAEKGLELADVLPSDPKFSKTAGMTTARGMKKARKPHIYFNPENPEQGWSGRGRFPNWVKAHIEAGGTLEDLRKNESKDSD